MKKELTILLSVLTLATSSFAFASCEETSNSSATGEVSDSVWQQSLSVDFGSIDSITAAYTFGSSYAESEAAEYGDYQKIDLPSLAMKYNSNNS